MKNYSVNKSTLRGDIEIPASKSHTLRAILFASLARGESLISHYLPSDDAQAMIRACRLFGAKIEVMPLSLKIQGIGDLTCTEDVIDAGNSGIVLRFCTAIGALLKRPVVITGDHSIRHQRPMKPLLEALEQLGVSATSMRDDYFAPVVIKGPIRGGKASVEGQDSQFVSALLIAGAFAECPLDLTVHNAGEKPWVGMTLDWFDRLGIPYVNHNFEYYQLQGKARYQGFEYAVPGDFSSAAFPIVAALITDSELRVKNVDMSDCQGDKELIYVLQKMGALIEIDEANKTLHVKRGSQLKGITCDINNFIDAITILAVVSCYANGETHIKNASIARNKECNRIQAIVTELKKMGADICETEDGLIIKGSVLKGTSLHTYNDHRMCMALSVAALGAEGESIIGPVECVSKTYPSFLQDFVAMGASMEEVE